MRASPASSSSSETRHLCRCVERYALFERFVDSLDSALRAELGRLQRALFETLLALLPSAPSSSPCTRRAFYRAHAAAALGDDDPAAALAEPPEPPASPPPPVRPVVLSAHARDAALRFLYAHAPDTLATLVLTRIPLRVASDTDTDVGADTDTDADTPAPWTAAVLAPLSPAALAVPRALACLSAAALRDAAAAAQTAPDPPPGLTGAPPPAFCAACEADAAVAAPARVPSVCMCTLLHAARDLVCATLGARGTVLAAGLADSTVRCWDFARTASSSSAASSSSSAPPQPLLSQVLHTDGTVLRGHSGAVYGAALSSDARWLATAGGDGAARLWAVDAGCCAARYAAHGRPQQRAAREPLWDAAFAPGAPRVFATAGHDRTARLWATGCATHAARVFVGHRSDVTAVRVHPGAALLATGSADRTARVWDIGTGRCVALLRHAAPVAALAFHPAGRRLAVATDDGAVALWDLQRVANGAADASPALLVNNTSSSEKKRGKVKAAAAPVHCLAFSTDGGVLATGGADCAVRLWDCSAPDTHAPALLRVLETKATPVVALEFTRTNVLMAAGAFHDTPAEAYLSPPAPAVPTPHTLTASKRP